MFYQLIQKEAKDQMINWTPLGTHPDIDVRDRVPQSVKLIVVFITFIIMGIILCEILFIKRVSNLAYGVSSICAGLSSLAQFIYNKNFTDRVFNLLFFILMLSAGLYLLLKP